MNHKQQTLEAGLYLVSTPIGSARDITLRALDVLASADILAAEDTRTARKLMEIHGIPLGGRRIIAYHDHSGPSISNKLLDHVRDGRSVAYVSEAGTPLVADPGYGLAVDVGKAGLTVTAVPGASAVLAALTVGGLPTDRFLFVGFLPASKSARRAALIDVAGVQGTLVFYESPRRVGETLIDMCDCFGGERQAVICRELTKKFEEIKRATLQELSDEIGTDALRGEVVILVDRAGEETRSEDDVETALRKAMANMRIKDAATLVAGALSMPRREVYQIALNMDKEA